MLKVNKLVAWPVFFSTVCLIPLSKGAFEPWASNTDPTDVPKSQVQEVTTSPFTYSITQGGTMDGRMCTTLPGVWEPYEQSWESTRSIRMENVGPSKVINPWLKIGPIDSKDWRKTVWTLLATLAEFDGKFESRTAMGNEYWIKCTLTGKASLSGVKIKNDIQMAPLAMPSMTVGNNRFTYLEHTDNRSGANAARHLRITHTWIERSRTRSPNASASPVHPANGGLSDGTDVVFQWNAATDPDGDAINDYHSQLADRADHWHRRWDGRGGDSQRDSHERAPTGA